MGKAARTKRTIKRAAEKRARKAANQAQFQRWAEDGKNQKSQRAQARNRRAAKVKQRNPDARNIGDLDAFPELNLEPLIRLYLAGQYRGRYKGRLRDIVESRRDKWLHFR